MSRVPIRTALALLIATLIGFGGALGAPFQFDDIDSIQANASILRLWPPTRVVSPPDHVAVSGRPVVNITLALNHAVNAALGVDQRPDPDGPFKTVGFHVFNLFAHLACGALLFGVLRRTLRSGRLGPDEAIDSDWFAGAVVALWLLHPIQTEAVDYVIQRTELIVSACYLGTLYASIRAWDAGSRRSRRWWLATSVLTCLIGMGSKEVMLTAPLMVVLYDRAFRSSSWRETFRAPGGRLGFYVLLAATVAWSLVLISGGSRSDSVGFGLGIPWYRYFLTQGWAITHYLRLVVWPVGLTLDYGQAPVPAARALPGLVLLGIAAAATVLAWRRADRWGWAAFLGSWFFLLLAPSSSVVPITTEVAAERRIYLALAAVLVFVVAGMRALFRRLAVSAERRGIGRPRAVLLGRAIGVALVLALMVMTARRSLLYAEPEALWRATIARVPENPRAYNSLAATLLAQRPKRYAEAEAAYRKAIALDSAYLPAWPNLAQLQFEQGRVAEADETLHRVLRSNPDYGVAIETLGNLLVRVGQPSQAIPLLERAVAHEPGEKNLVTLATAYMAKGRYADAVGALEQVVRIDPDRPDVMSTLGGLLAEQGRGAEAVPYLEAAVDADSGTAIDLARLSLADAEAGRVREAEAAASAASSRGGEDGNVFVLAGRAMLRSQRPAEAEVYLSEAVRLRPRDPAAITRLGIAEAQLGKRGDASKLFERALGVAPDYTPAKQALEALEQFR